MRALSLRQPWADLVILGQKTIEVRSRRTKIRERVYIYAARNRIEADEEHRIAARFGIDVDNLARGVLVGTVEIVDCLPLKKVHGERACFKIDKSDGFHAWLLERPERAKNLRTPTKRPQPVFFNPF
jgi:hypothetical protein